MKPGFVKCPLCKRPVQLIRDTRMRPHWATLSKPGMGFRGNAQKCPGGNKRPEEFE